MFKEVILPKLVLFNTRLVVNLYTALSLPFYTVAQKPWQVIRNSKQKWVKIEKSPDGSYFYWKRIGDRIKFPNDYHLSNSFQEVFIKMKKIEDMSQPKLSYRKVLSSKIKCDDNGQPVKQDGRDIREIKLADKYTSLTAKETFDEIDYLTRGFKALGINSKDKVILFADTRIEWFLSSLSLLLLRTPIVTLFSNLGINGFIHGVNQTKAKYIITSIDLLEKILKVVDQIPDIEKIIYMTDDSHSNHTLPIFPKRIQLLSFDHVKSSGQKAEKISLSLPESDETAMIMYTSGTTGTPKAVIFSNKQLHAAILCLASNVIDIAHEAPRHCYASFLPLAHILGFTFELFFFMGGVRIGYTTPHTLTDNGVAHPKGQIGDLKLLQPTTLVTVPLILDRIVKEIYAKLSSRSPILPPLFTYLMDYKIRWIKRGYQTPILNKIVCQRVQEQFGGKLEIIVCGGAALNPATEEFIQAALNVKLLQGYGLTETTGGVLGKRRDDINSGQVGYPLDGVGIRFIDWKEGGYTMNDKPNPRGEILVSGDCIAQGYYNLEDETKSAFTTDSQGLRWFHTGDIGEISPNGSVKIIDRRKDLAKLPNGEYISLGKIESIVKTTFLVENCCICLSNKVNSIVALVTPNAKGLKNLAVKLNKSNLSHEQLCQDFEVKTEFFDQIKQRCVQANLHPREIPVKIYLCEEEWLPDNDLLTSAFKVKRANVNKYYQKEIEALFDSVLNFNKK